MRPIVVGVTEGSQVIVSSGLAAGEQVVIDGLEKLKDGSRVSFKQNGPSMTDRKSRKDVTPEGGVGQDARHSAQSGEGIGKHKHSKQGSSE
jgi:multidrug efflux system membrane fusion protein